MSNEIANLTALVKELREKSGVGILACRKALVEANGDIDKAYDLLRSTGEKLARSKAEREATEGKIVCVTGDNDVVMVGVNCETDFVSQGEDFQNFAQQVAQLAYDNQCADADALLALPMGEGTVETARVALIGRIGENIQISSVNYHKEDNGSVGVYSHGDKLACAVFVAKADETVAKDIGMHVVAMNPMGISADDVPADVVEREKALFAAQTEKMGKPEFAEKIIEGKMAKFFKEICLLDQGFVKDPDTSIRNYLKQADNQVLRFIRVELG